MEKGEKLEAEGSKWAGTTSFTKGSWYLIISNNEKHQHQWYLMQESGYSNKRRVEKLCTGAHLLKSKPLQMNPTKIRHFISLSQSELITLLDWLFNEKCNNKYALFKQKGQSNIGTNSDSSDIWSWRYPIYLDGIRLSGYDCNRQAEFNSFTY